MSNKPGYSLTHEDMEKLWKSSSDEGKYYLFSTFGVKKETFLPDIMERVTDYNSAVAEVEKRSGWNAGTLRKPVMYNSRAAAFNRLCFVADALNEGCPEEEKVWLPLIGKNGYATTVNTARRKIVLIEPSLYEATTHRLASMQLASAKPLMVRSEKLAAYFGKQFEFEWKILYS